MSAHAHYTDENLLFGILALQRNFVDRDALISAMHAWVLDKAKPLSRIFLEQQALNAEDYDLLQALVRKHIQKHGGDVQKSLATLGAVGSVREELHEVADAELHASLAQIGTAAEVVDPYATRDASVAVPNASGSRFRVLRPHAKGGLGEVFVARDEELHREVALKEIQNRHADEPHSRARFVLEAEITGGLEHPGIVPVYGLGSYADGRPFYAMRFIRGDSLQDAIKRFHAAERPQRDPGERTLALRELLGRFVDVCNAIAYAHARGVLHRDLKPGNVMLGKYGETLVVDWGLAKVAGRAESTGNAEEATLRPSSASGSAPTQMGTALGTPAFMSPEQAAGRVDQLGPASDIYSLGATLYCLLTGQTPFRGEDVGIILQEVQRGTFPPPRQIKREVPAALQAICLKAMALQPADRYATALALAADVEHWLADEPVSAYREPLHVRAGRWARRHQTLMAASVTGILVLVLAGGAGAWWLDRQRTEQRQGIELALVELERLQGQSRWNEARAVLGQVRDRLGQSGPVELRQRLEEEESNLDLVARLEAIRLRRVTVIQGKTDRMGADREYEETFRQAGRIRVDGDIAAAASWVRRAAIRVPLLSALDDWSICENERQRRDWLLSVARAADADPWRDRVRDIKSWEDKDALVRLMKEREIAEQSPQFLVAVAWQMLKLGADAEPLLRTARQLHPGDFWVNFQLGNVLAIKGSADAVGYYLSALALRPATPVVHGNLGVILFEIGRYEEAVAEDRKAIELDPNYAGAYRNLGQALSALGRSEEAVTASRKAIELDPKDVAAHYNLACTLTARGKDDEAIDTYRKTLELQPDYAEAHCNLGHSLRRQGRFAEAVAALRRGHELGSKKPRWSYPSAQWLRQTERLSELDAKLPAILKGDAKAADTGEKIDLVLLCYLKKRYVAATRFSADVLAIEPKLANDLRAEHRYNAACVAALAAAGQGADAAMLDDNERARFRKQARDWLLADLALWGKQLDKGTPQERAAVRKALRHWQQDTDLAGLRDKDALAKLPEAERAEWRKLWDDVEALRQRAAASK